MDVSIFDLDRTLTKVGTYTPFLIFAALHRAPWRLLLLPLWLAAMAGYVIGLFNRKKLKEIGFLLLLGRRVSQTALTRIAQDFTDRLLPLLLLPAAAQQLASDRARGNFLMLATASPDYYAKIIADRLGFQAVVATQQARTAAGDYLYRIEGENCYGAAKLRMVEAAWPHWAELRNVRSISFYSDSASDAPMLSWAQHAVAVNPSRRLRKLAAERGWAVLDLA
jgi:HAD superfamily hydrolase (TIGR01490 family)